MNTRDSQIERAENWEVRNATEAFIRRIHADGDGEIQAADIPTLLEAIADEFERLRDGYADALQATKDLLILCGRVKHQLEHSTRIAAKVGVKVSVLRGTVMLQDESPHPMLCVAHGGSPACEQQNREHGMKCPRCP